jgi:hypothetical protein
LTWSRRDRLQRLVELPMAVDLLLHWHWARKPLSLELDFSRPTNALRIGLQKEITRRERG